ncbi:13E12 repeat family protein, partial [Mycolicibacterium sp. 3033]|nr:13E12 repeat family protein [Mycolicibacterium aurantiacum]
MLHAELAELTGQRNAIDARIVQIASEIDRDELWAAAGARSTAGWLAWKAGVSPSRAQTIATIAARYDEFPECVEGLTQGRFSVDQVGVIAEHGLPGSDSHFATMAQSATVTQLRTALKMQPKPTPEPQPEPNPDEDAPAPVADPGPQVSISSRSDEQYTYWQITLPHVENAAFEAALASHRDA